METNNTKHTRFWLFLFGPLVYLFPKHFKTWFLTFSVPDEVLSQKRVVRTKLDIYLFITITGTIPLPGDY